MIRLDDVIAERISEISVSKVELFYFDTEDTIPGVGLNIKNVRSLRIGMPIPLNENKEGKEDTKWEG